MALPERVRCFLDGLGIAYSLIDHPPAQRIQQAARLAGLDPASVARAVVVDAGARQYLVVLPADRLLDFASLEAAVGAAPEIASPECVRRLFPDCAARTTPAFGQAYGLPVLVDAALDQLAELHLAVGCHGRLLRLEGGAFARAFADLPRAPLSRTPSQVPTRQLQASMALVDNPYLPPEVDLQCLAHLYALPPMPHSAARILQLRADPDASIQALSAIVEADPSLAAQVVRFARSPFFGYRGEISSITDAIHRVLGFDMVVNMALGLSAGRPFHLPESGPLGLNAFWRHAIYSAALAQQLARRLHVRQGVKPGLAYLGGLLHNFGYLLLGHLFKPEFTLLNRMAGASPEVPVVRLEEQVLGMGEGRRVVAMGHARMGAWLMHAWGMPQEVVVSLAEHHNENYIGEHAGYAAVVLLADRLARRLQLGDGDSEELPPALLERLGLDAALVEEVYGRVLAGGDGLEAMAAAIAA